MKKFSWRDLAEIIGHVTIVAGLIFVGLQLNQSQDIAIATQYQERAAAAVEFNILRAQHPVMHSTYVALLNFRVKCSHSYWLARFGPSGRAAPPPPLSLPRSGAHAVWRGRATRPQTRFFPSYYRRPSSAAGW